MDEDVFDELFNDSSNEAEEVVASGQSQDNERIARVKKILTEAEVDSESSSGEENSTEEDSEEDDDNGFESDNSARPKNRPKMIPTGAQSDDKIMEARRDFEEALAKMKPTRNRREVGTQDTDLDDLAIQFTNKMLAAVKADDEAVSAERPALGKLKMLAEVEDMLTKKHMQEILLDNQVLDCIKKWLEPNMRGHLAVPSLRKRLLELLLMLPIETTHLRESGLGKIVLFYYTRQREALDIRKLAGDLIALWSRPIIGSSLDYREMLKREGYEEGDDDGDVEGYGGRGKTSIKQLQSDKFKKLARSGALDRDSGPKDGRYQRLINRQKSKKKN